MAEMPELDGEDLRVMVRQRLAARSHWMVLLSDDERRYTPEILASTCGPSTSTPSTPMTAPWPTWGRCS